MSRRRNKQRSAETSSQGPAKGRCARPSIYDEVTARIIAQLEAGRVPWVQPWEGAQAGLGLPRNVARQCNYTGINILILWNAVVDRGFSLQHWLTYNQAKALGGFVREGETGTTVLYTNTFTPKAQKERGGGEGDEAANVRFLKRFTVFNVAQCEGLPEAVVATAAPHRECEIIPAAEHLIAATGATIQIGGGVPFYQTEQDYIQLPSREAFPHQVDFYDTCLHELGHWTGHASRLNRFAAEKSKSHPRAREELVAEMTAAFVGTTLGLTPTVRHADYLGYWLQVMKEDNRAIFHAASQASKAADFILSFRNQPQASAVGEAA